MQASLFYLLLLVHLIVDFMQPASLVAWSKSSSWGLVVHSSVYLLINCVVLAFTPLWWLWALILAISHFVLDKIKVLLHDKVPRAGVVIFIVDQVIHIAIIACIFLVGGLGKSKPLPKILHFLNYSQALLYAVGYVAVTFGGSILIFEILNSLGSAANSKKVISMKERYQGILERTIALTLILLGHVSGLFPLAAPLAFIPSVIEGKKVWERKAERSQFLLAFVTSVSLAFSVGFILYLM